MRFNAYLFAGVFLVFKGDQRSFVIDYENDRFLKDGEPFRYISGSMHYFRVPRIYWKDRFERFLAAGLNTVQTYIDWALHEPLPGIYNFEGDLDFVEYIKTAQTFGLLVILRPGPYIDSERDLGGLPFWLLQKKKDIQLRTNDPTYIKYVDQWFKKIFPMIKPLLYINGGPIISVQVENEYGYYFPCDFDYTSHLRDIFRKYLGNDVILFTTDPANDTILRCGKIQDTFTTVDFGPATNVSVAFKALRNHQPRGPLVNSEFYPGWLDHWAHPHANYTDEFVVTSLKEMLELNASVNIYIFHGGTNFGFSNGANFRNDFLPVTTSYDFDAPLSESGDQTDKYFAIRNLIQTFTEKPLPPVPKPIPKYAYGTVKLSPIGSIFKLLSKIQKGSSIYSLYPLTFEDLGQAHGFVIYETLIRGLFPDPILLQIPGVHDRAIIFIDEKFVGILSRQDAVFSLPVTVFNSQKLSILVENMGRICFGDEIGDFKGLTSNVTLGDRILTKWKMYKLPFNNKEWLHFSLNIKHLALESDNRNEIGFFAGKFVVPQGENFPQDTFLDPKGWFKGVAFINEFNLGRYWPIVGPQRTLYVPKNVLKPYPQENWITLFELENPPCHVEQNCSVVFVDTAIINSPTPHNEQIFD